ncbi:hypothetical protein [Cellulomonas sp. ATA003]|uniref:restriction endonuclease subunit S n=1 Tax=Cellulomonas sp. ATA003 TaxID=3073064 RepID=UPI002873CA5F|nr:hypothetical protein [Cellulomonas sp. ATA003]WNB85480.1 hypothetical protein REH70_18255 [Cellulomonas sp. ATA003]
MFVRTADDENHNAIPEDLTNYKVALSGDLVINKMKAWQGSLGLAPCDGLVSPAYYVYGVDFDDRYYLQALLRSRRYVDLFAAASDGVRIGQWDLAINRFRGLPVLIPSAHEQAAIVKYLSHAHHRIAQTIAAKRKLITLLEEQKQAIINKAVSRGLDSTAPSKTQASSGWDRYQLTGTSNPSARCRHSCRRARSAASSTPTSTSAVGFR